MPRDALAGGKPDPGTQLYDLRESERQLDLRREAALRRLEERQQSQAIEADDALMERTRINNEYQRELGALRAQENDAYKALGDRRKPAGGGSPAAPNPALPRIPSQSIVTYPQGGSEDGEPAPAQTTAPAPDNRQRNVGLGTRELEF